MAEQLNFIAGDGVFTIDRQQRIVCWNQAAEEILGYARETSVGRPCWQILQGCSVDGEQLCHPGCPIFQAAIRGEPAGSFDLFALTRTGRRVLLAVSAMTLLEEPGPQPKGGAADDDPILLLLFRRVTEPASRPGQICLCLLGRCRGLRSDGSPIGDRDWRGLEARALLALLVAGRGEAVRREALIDAIWPGVEPTQAARHLDATVAALCQLLLPALPDHASPLFHETAGGWRLEARGRLWLDVEAFEEGIHHARLEADPHRAITLYVNALNLYRGAFAADLPAIGGAVAAERERLQDLYLAALLELGQRFEHLGQPQEARRHYRRAVEVDPDLMSARRLLRRLDGGPDDYRATLLLCQRLVNALKTELDAALAQGEERDP